MIKHKWNAILLNFFPLSELFHKLYIVILKTKFTIHYLFVYSRRSLKLNAVSMVE